MDTVSVSPFKAVGVQQRQEKLEILFLAIVRSRRHQQKMPRELAKKLAESISLCVLDLVAEVRCGHLVGLVTNDEVPIGVRQLCLNVFIAAQLIEAADGHRILSEPVSSTRRFKFVVCQNLEGKLKPLIEFVLPLLGEIAGAHDKTAVQVAAHSGSTSSRSMREWTPARRMVGSCSAS